MRRQGSHAPLPGLKMTEYALVEILSSSLIGVESGEYGRQLFSSRKLRKACRCTSCKIEIPKGATAWAEVTSCAANRMERLHASCIVGTPRSWMDK